MSTRRVVRLDEFDHDAVACAVHFRRVVQNTRWRRFLRHSVSTSVMKNVGRKRKDGDQRNFTLISV